VLASNAIYRDQAGGISSGLPITRQLRILPNLIWRFPMLPRYCRIAYSALGFIQNGDVRSASSTTTYAWAAICGWLNSTSGYPAPARDRV
jgi:hypothetical protein